MCRIECIYKYGRLDEATRYLTRAERSSSHTAAEAGFHFCQVCLIDYDI